MNICTTLFAVLTLKNYEFFIQPIFKLNLEWIISNLYRFTSNFTNCSIYVEDTRRLAMTKSTFLQWIENSTILLCARFQKVFSFENRMLLLFWKFVREELLNSKNCWKNKWTNFNRVNRLTNTFSFSKMHFNGPPIL